MQNTRGNARFLMKIESELMRGAGPTAVMQLLSGGEKYGYELVEALARQSNGVLAMGQSTLYPLLYNLEAKGLVTSRVDESGARPRRFYRLTQQGPANWATKRNSGKPYGKRFARSALQVNRSPVWQEARDDGCTFFRLAPPAIYAVSRCSSGSF